MDDDKYPPESDRRRFVKGVVGSAALAGVATTGGAAIDTLTAPSGEGGGATTYFGFENTGGPAPRGMPQIPVEIDSEGFVRGVFPEYETRTVGGREVDVAETEIAGETYSARWFQYCGVQTYAGILPDADQDNYFRYASSSPYDWQGDLSGRMHVDDFEEVGESYEAWGNGIGQSGLGKPARGTWRSEGIKAAETMPVEVIRSPIIEEKAQDDEWLAATTDRGVAARLNKCTHFCCVPGFKAQGDAANFGAADRIYCQCHQSVYDPFTVVKTQFTALPRPGN
ncbi:cytochrome B [Halobacteriales archaeon SW_7_68_16]|nr:MAG: cytochrome B [Halobacteriales archaeon SW_7_68_16]